jgi:3-methylcrotonyl-CoA carboxylase alpha subunit
MKSIKKILVANRGEIAIRVSKTAKRLGIQTVGVYSDADAGSLYLKFMDESFGIGGNEPKESYLKIASILEVAKKSNSDAIHPGYGFLSENAEFAQAVMDAGIIWLGPSPHAIRKMGDKITARDTVIEMGVPVVPGYSGEDNSIPKLKSEAKRIGYPVLLKATGGGGGKGMRRVDREEDLESALESAQREASKAFGNSKVFLEKYILNPRHIEVQILGDTHGNIIHCLERDCSAQRRHQKVVEEAPAPLIDPSIKQKMYSAAINAGKSVDYTGAGTVEFVYGNGEFFFLEMNTRLQVEHPVTESITGLDLVEMQIRIAEGKSIPDLIQGKDLSKPIGHSIEVRIYSEDPENQFLPSVGKLHRVEFPEDPNIRVEQGIAQGNSISVFYDPMIAKVISKGKNRDEAIEQMLSYLSKIILFGTRTNINYLQKIISSEGFRIGGISTHFLEEKVIAAIDSDQKIKLAEIAQRALETKISKESVFHRENT